MLCALLALCSEWVLGCGFLRCLGFSVLWLLGFRGQWPMGSSTIMHRKHVFWGGAQLVLSVSLLFRSGVYEIGFHV